MRITILAGEFPRRSETFVLDQVLYLARAGHQVSVICTDLCDMGILDPEDAATLRDVEIAIWPRDTGAIRRLPWRVRMWLLRFPARWTVRRRQADLILAHFGHSGARLAGLFKRAQDFPPLVTVYHGYDVAMEWQANRMSQYKHLFRTGALHLPVNGAFAALLTEAGAPPERVKTHHLGVPVEEYLWQARQPLTGRPLQLLSVCRLVEKKGLSIALQALALLHKEHPALDWQYDIGGDGPEAEPLQHLATTLGIADRVRFLGPLKHADTLARIAAADVMVQPSVTAANGDQEGIPVILMEAMALGTIVCTTRHSGIPELVEHGVSGLLADEHDARGLADNLLRIASGELDILPISRAARDKVERDFNATVQNAALAKLCADAARGHRPKAGA